MNIEKEVCKSMTKEYKANTYNEIWYFSSGLLMKFLFPYFIKRYFSDTPCFYILF